MDKNRLLVWGPEADAGGGPWWDTILDHLKYLKEQRWGTINCALGDTYGALTRARTFEQAHALDLGILEIPGGNPARKLSVDLSKREYTPAEINRLTKELPSEILNLEPTVILTRGPNAPYLEELFPGTTVLNLIEGTLPHLSQGKNDIVLLPGHRLWGSPYFEEHKETILKNYEAPKGMSAALADMRKAIVEEYRAATNSNFGDIQKYVNELRAKFRKVILFPFEYFGQGCEFAVNHHTLLGDQSENLAHLIAKCPKDYAFVCSFHPLNFNPRNPDKCDPGSAERVLAVRQRFEQSGRVRFPQLDLTNPFVTHPLVYLTDATAMQYSKTGFLAMLFGKPIIKLGVAALNFYPDIHDLSNVDAAISGFKPDQKPLDAYFSWIITDYKHGLGQSHQYFSTVLGRAGNLELVNSGRLFDCLTQEERQKNFVDMWAMVTKRKPEEFSFH